MGMNNENVMAAVNGFCTQRNCSCF